MNIVAPILFATGFCLILRSLIEIVPKIKQRRKDKKEQS